MSKHMKELYILLLGFGDGSVPKNAKVYYNQELLLRDLAYYEYACICNYIIYKLTDDLLLERVIKLSYPLNISDVHQTYSGDKLVDTIYFYEWTCKCGRGNHCRFNEQLKSGDNIVCDACGLKYFVTEENNCKYANLLVERGKNGSDLRKGDLAMTKKEKNIINVLKEMSKHFYDKFETNKRNGDGYSARYYFGVSIACDSFIGLITDEKKLNELAEMFKVKLI